MKYTIWLIIALLLLSFTACSDNVATPTDSGSPLTTETASATTGETSSGTDESEPTETVVSDKPTSTPAHSNSTTPTPGNSNSTPPATTNPPATSQPPPTTSKPPEQPNPTDPPPTSTPTPAFNPQIYYDYALSYGKSIGLNFYSDMNTEENAWNAPQNLYAALSDETMKRNIRSGCDFIKFEGFEYFGLYLEKQPNGTTYRLYIMYG